MAANRRRMTTATARTLNATVIALVFATLSLAIALALIVSIQLSLNRSADALAAGLTLILPYSTVGSPPPMPHGIAVPLPAQRIAALWS